MSGVAMKPERYVGSTLRVPFPKVHKRTYLWFLHTHRRKARNYFLDIRLIILQLLSGEKERSLVRSREREKKKKSVLKESFGEEAFLPSSFFLSFFLFSRAMAVERERFVLYRNQA